MSKQTVTQVTVTLDKELVGKINDLNIQSKHKQFSNKSKTITYILNEYFKSKVVKKYMNIESFLSNITSANKHSSSYIKNGEVLSPDFRLSAMWDFLKLDLSKVLFEATASVDCGANLVDDGSWDCKDNMFIVSVYINAKEKLLKTKILEEEKHNNCILTFVRKLDDSHNMDVLANLYNILYQKELDRNLFKEFKVIVTKADKEELLLNNLYKNLSNNGLNDFLMLRKLNSLNEKAKNLEISTLNGAEVKFNTFEHDVNWFMPQYKVAIPNVSRVVFYSGDKIVYVTKNKEVILVKTTHLHKNLDYIMSDEYKKDGNIPFSFQILKTSIKDSHVIETQLNRHLDIFAEDLDYNPDDEISAFASISGEVTQGEHIEK